MVIVWQIILFLMLCYAGLQFKELVDEKGFITACYESFIYLVLAAILLPILSFVGR